MPATCVATARFVLRQACKSGVVWSGSVAGVARSYKCLQVFLKALDLFLMNILRQLHHITA